MRDLRTLYKQIFVSHHCCLTRSFTSISFILEKIFRQLDLISRYKADNTIALKLLVLKSCITDSIIAHVLSLVINPLFIHLSNKLKLNLRWFYRTLSLFINDKELISSYICRNIRTTKYINGWITISASTL